MSEKIKLKLLMQRDRALSDQFNTNRDQMNKLESDLLQKYETLLGLSEQNNMIATKNEFKLPSELLENLDGMNMPRKLSS